VDEATWLACEHPEVMLDFLPGRASQRKLRLFACACARRVWNLLTNDQSRKAVEAAERRAEGRITEGTLGRWAWRAAHVRDSLDHGQGWTPELLAAHAVVCAADRESSGGHLRTHQAVARAVATAADSRRDSAAWTRAVLAEYGALGQLLRDLVGNPFRPVSLDRTWLSWNGTTVSRLARTAYDNRDLPSGHLDPARLAVLADALEEAGCADADLLGHLRSPGPHVRGCFAVDALLGRE
jgi:hypothetical protein